MYIWLFSRSLGAGSATTWNTRGLTRSVIALMVPPLPAPSRPSNTTQTLRPLCCTHCCSLTSSTCSFFNSLSYALPLSVPSPASSVSFCTLAFLFAMRASPTVERLRRHRLPRAASPDDIGNDRECGQYEV